MTASRRLGIQHIPSSLQPPVPFFLRPVTISPPARPLRPPCPHAGTNASCSPSRPRACSPPSSPASFDYSYSSPEPPGTPVRYSSPVSPMRSGERSSSMPSQLRVPTNFDLNPPMAPAWCSGAGDTQQSSVGWVDVKPKTYSAAYWQSLHSTDFNPLIDSPDAEFNPYTTAQSAGLAQSPSTSSVQSALGAFTYGSSEYFSVSSSLRVIHEGWHTDHGPTVSERRDSA